MKNLLYTLVALFIISCTSDSEQKSPQVELAYKDQAALGEGPIWHRATQQLYWVDIEGKRLCVFDPASGQNTSYPMPSRVGTVVIAEDGRPVLALEDGVYIFNPDDLTLDTVRQIDGVAPNHRLNDGKCDPLGRLWVGSMRWTQDTASGGLYVLEGLDGIDQKLDNVTISNGIVWSADAKTMYYIDTPTGVVKAFDYVLADGQISNERVAITIPDSLGFPDGMAIDAEDNVWIGLWNGDGIIKCNPKTGEILEKINVPAHNVTACAFGGPALDTLFITTARLDMSGEELKKYPHAGSIFKYVPGVKGVESPLFYLK